MIITNIKYTVLLAALMRFGYQSLSARTALNASAVKPPELHINMTVQKYRYTPKIIKVPFNAYESFSHYDAKMLT